MQIELPENISVRELINISCISAYMDYVPEHSRRAEVAEGIWIIENKKGRFKYSKVWQSGFGYIYQPVPIQPCFLPVLEQWMSQNGVEPTEDFPI